MARGTLIFVGLLALAGAGWQLSAGSGSWPAQSTGEASPADVRQREILRENIGRPADPDLARRFAAVNSGHFANALPATPVVWEPRLAEIGALAGRSFTLLGVFGHFGDRTVILLHPSLKADAEALDRALCHEMVHAYLFTLGDRSTDHGEAFQAVLHRLSSEGAFVSLAASPEERARLRAWLDEESARLDAERQALETAGPELERERAAIEEAVAAMNARASAAAASGRGGLSEQDVAALNTRRDEYNRRAESMNHRSLEFRLAQEAFNREVARYNLMVTYPDGLDEGASVKPRTMPPVVR